MRNSPYYVGSRGERLRDYMPEASVGILNNVQDRNREAGSAACYSFEHTRIARGEFGMVEGHLPACVAVYARLQADVCDYRRELLGTGHSSVAQCDVPTSASASISRRLPTMNGVR